MEPFGNIRIIESDLLPKERTVTTRRNWVSRDVAGKIVFDHTLRHRGSKYATRTIPQNAYIFKHIGMDIAVMSREWAAIVRMDIT